jgi:hypothetical protein
MLCDRRIAHQTSTIPECAGGRSVAVAPAAAAAAAVIFVAAAAAVARTLLGSVGFYRTDTLECVSLKKSCYFRGKPLRTKQKRNFKKCLVVCPVGGK